MPTIPTTDGSSNTQNTLAEQHESKHIKVYLTGYGPFRGIPENPSGEIANSLRPETHIYIHPTPHLTLHISIYPHQNPVRVAYADVDRTISDIYNTEAFDYILHVGVGLTGGFELEKIAHRDGYYMGDVDDLVPGGEKAKSDEQLKREGLLRHWGGDGTTGPGQDTWMGTGLDVDWIVEMVQSGKIKLSDSRNCLQREYTAAVDEEVVKETTTAYPKKHINNLKKAPIPNGYKIRASKDAGRYLCEYIYRKSLEQAISQRKNGARKPWSWRNWTHDTIKQAVPVDKREEDNTSKRVLFMHVPPAGNIYTVQQDIDCVMQVIVGMVLDGEGLGKN